MEIESLKRLEEVNQLALTDIERSEISSFITLREKEFEPISSINTEKVEIMVHVMPINTVVRDDISKQPFERDALQEKAPETDEGYWCVPKVLD